MVTAQRYRLGGEIATKSELMLKDPDAYAYFKAYDQALEFKKHGRPITLPNHLINDVQSNLHRHLIKEQEAEENLDDDANKFAP